MDDKLQKLLAHAGLGSRREIEKWIEGGRISVNGKRAKLGDRAALDDRILVDGRLIALQATRFDPIKAIVYHKPEGEICTRKDPQGRPTVFENLPAIPNGRWVSVGRLDINTSGLLLFTNSGELANKLMHPSTGLEREYLVRIRGKASDSSITKLTRTGVQIDGRPAKFESVVQADMAEEGTNHWYRVVIKEGRYREVRRLWDAVGHTVSRLKRVRYGTIKLSRDLKRGKVAKMAPLQLEKLVSGVGLHEEFASQLYSAGRSTGAKNAKKRLSSGPAGKGQDRAARNSSEPNGHRRKKNTGSGAKFAKGSASNRRSSSNFEKTMESGSGSSSQRTKRKKVSSRKPTR